MSTAEERLKILNMISEGKLTAEEGTKLLKALTQSRAKRRGQKGEQPGAPEVRFMRVCVTDCDSGKQKVNVNVPISLIEVGLRMGARFVPDMDEFDFEEVRESIQMGMHGKVVDIESDDSDEHIEIYLE